MAALDSLSRHCQVVARRLGEGKVIPFLGAGANLCERPPGASWHRLRRATQDVSHGFVLASLRGQFRPGTFRGKIVVVGPTAPSLQDVHRTPAGGADMSGAEIQANVVATALRGFPLRTRKQLDLALIALLGLIVPLASYRLRSIASLGIAFFTAALYVVGLVVAFDHDVLLAAVYPLIALALTTVFAVGWAFRHRMSQSMEDGPGRRAADLPQK